MHEHRKDKKERDKRKKQNKEKKIKKGAHIVRENYFTSL
jgi:hypothetical protein